MASRRWAVWGVLPLLLGAIVLSSALPGRRGRRAFQAAGADRDELLRSWRLPATIVPAGADSDVSKRVRGGTFTDWFDLGKYGGTKLHSRLNRAGGIAEILNIGLTSSPARTALRGRS
jgi:hypothetical protein